MTSLELLLCVAMVLFSGFLSASEIALFSLSRFQLRSLRERVRPAHRKIKRLLADPTGLLISILVLNEILNIFLSGTIARAIARQRITVPQFLAGTPDWAIDAVLGIVVTTPVVLLFCEISPKVTGARANQLIATMTAGPMMGIYNSMRPIRAALTRILNYVTRAAKKKKSGPNGEDLQQDESVLKESEFLMMVEEGHKEGLIREGEVELIRNVFEFDDTTVADIYTPLPQVLSLSVGTTLKGALLALRGEKFSRIPITSPNRKNVVGILYAKDLLRAKLESDLLALSVSSVMKRPLFVNTGLKVSALFRKFKQQKMHMAVVQNANGETLGIVTMSDVLDTLLEDFLPDNHEPPQKPAGMGAKR